MMIPSANDSAASLRLIGSHASREIPADALLPQLTIILDPDAMKTRLQESMFGSPQERERFRIRACSITQVRYKPESSCLVTYQLELEDTATCETGMQILCGRAYPEGGSHPYWVKARGRAVVQPRFGNPLVHLPDLEMVLWSFPNDRKMDTLPTLADTDHFTRAILPTLLTSYLGQEWRLTEAHRTLIHYVGEHTCTVRIDATAEHQENHRLQTVKFFEKTYYNEDSEQNFHVMRQLWESEAQRSGRLVIAPPVMHDSSLKTFWQLGLSGVSFDSCDVYDPEFLPSFEQAARLLAALHLTPITCTRSTAVADLIADLNRVMPALIRFRPSCGPALRPLMTRLLAQAEQMPEEPRATLHGDLHLGNLFITDDRVALIDLDNVRIGPPLLDLGSLVAGLYYVRLLRGASPESCHRLVQRFLQTYQANVPWTVLAVHLNWYVAVTLLTERASRCLTRLKEGRPAMVEELIALAGRLSQDSTTCEC